MASEWFFEFLERQWAWSRATFGPLRRVLGVTRHMEKEIAEVRAHPEDLSEWVDLILLALDGYWRNGGTRESLRTDLEATYQRNLARTWPPPTSEHEAVEHIRNL